MHVLRAVTALVAYNTTIEGMMKRLWKSKYGDVITANSIPPHFEIHFNTQYIISKFTMNNIKYNKNV